MAFNAKNLTYESKDPSFLRKLKGEFGGTDSARHRQPQARAKKLRSTEDEDDDQPVYVHDQDPSEVLSKAEYDALVKAPSASTEQHPVEEAQLHTNAHASEEKVSLAQANPGGQMRQESEAKETIAGIGGSSKKRSAKIVGDDASSDEISKSETAAHVVKKQAPKKGKKIKLSFEDS
ncbi:MAG: hypothetical protein Q9168_000598 [Polycauliona sp. 1 TL-2023]